MRTIQAILHKTRAPWNSDEIKDRIRVCAKDIKSIGLYEVFERVLEDVYLFRRKGKEEILLKCIEMYVQHEGQLSSSAQELCDKVTMVLI